MTKVSNTQVRVVIEHKYQVHCPLYGNFSKAINRKHLINSVNKFTNQFIQLLLLYFFNIFTLYENLPTYYLSD